MDLSRSVGLSASQSFEPLYGDVYSCRLTKKRVSSVFNFLLSHPCLTHIIFTSFLGHIISIDIFFMCYIETTSYYFMTYHMLEYTFYDDIPCLVCLQCEFIQLY